MFHRLLPPGPVRLGVTAALLTLATAGTAAAGEDYYLLMFGAQRTPNTPNHSHTWATFVRVTWVGDGPCPAAGAVLEAHSISWLPANLIVRVNALCPEPGHNFTLEETLRWAYGIEDRVSLWGPYRIHPELYALSLKQKALLESGTVQYKCYDAGYPTSRASNCIHAVSSTVAGYRFRIGVPGWGEVASYFVLEDKLRPYILDDQRVYPWVGSALGLDQYPIIYRDWVNPRSGGVAGALGRALGSEKNLQATYGPPR